MAGPWDSPPTEADLVETPRPRPTVGVWAAPPRPDEAVAPEAAPAPAGPPTGDELQAVHDAVGPVNADEQAKVLRLSDRTGVPREVVGADPAGFEKGLVPGPDFRSLAAHSPVVAQHVADPANMAAAKDDLGPLSGVEWALQFGLLGAVDWSIRKAGDGGDRPLWLDSLKKGWAGLRQSLDKTREQLGLSPAVGATLYEVTEGIFSVFDPAYAQPTSAEETVAAMRRADAVRAAREIQAKGIAARVWAGTFEAAPFVLGAIGAGAAAGPAGAIAFGAAATYGPVREQLGQIQGPQSLAARMAAHEVQFQPLTEAEKTALAVPTALLVGVAQAIPISKWIGTPLFKALPTGILDRVFSSTTVPAILGKFAARWGAHNAAGAAGMAAGVAIQDLAMELAAGRVDPYHEPDFGKVRDDTWQSYQGALLDFALISGVGSGRQMLHDFGVREASRQQAARLQAVAEQLKASKLVDRSPEAVQGLVAQMAPGSSMLVDRQAWDGYWRGKNQDPAKVAADVARDGGKAYEAAQQAGGFVALPLESYLARFGKTEHILGLAADSKFTADARTPREQAAFDREDQRLVEEARKARGAEFEAEKRKIVETIQKAAESNPRLTKEEVEAVATLIGEAAGTVALRTGLPVPEAAVLMGLRRLRVLGPEGEQVARVAQVDLRSQLTPEAVATIDAARAGDRRAQERLERQAYQDPLTGILNAVAFQDYRRHRGPAGWDVAVDANDLKAQDVLGGHDVGDAMLRAVASAMQKAGEGTEARLFRRGGDEFHAGGFKTRAEAEGFAAALQGALKGGAEVAKGFRVSAAIGVGPDVAAADAALYEAKAAKVSKVGRFEKGGALAPELAAGESFVATRATAGAPPGEREITRVADKPVILVAPAVDRSAARVVTPQRPMGEPVRYDVREAADVIASHSEETFRPTPEYPADVQERQYQRLEEEQAKVIRGAKALDATLLLTDTPSAVDGPPLVTGGERALVLGGNGRTMMLKRAFREDPKALAAYRDELQARAATFGIDPARVEGMKEPVLVRVADEVPANAPKADLVAAVRRFNESMTQQLSPKIRAVSEGKNLPAKAISGIADVLARSEGSLRETMTELPGPFIDILRQAGIVTDQNRSQFLLGRRFTEEGKDRVEGMLQGLVLGTAERMLQSATPLLNKIERIVAPLAKVEGANPALSAIPLVQRAIDLVNEARIRNLKVDEVANQMSLFTTERPDPAAVGIARLLEKGKPKEIEAKFKAWAQMAGYDPAQATLFGPPPTSADALAILLGRETALAQAGRPRTLRIADLVLDQKNLEEARANVRRGAGAVDTGPIIVYRREGTKKLEVGNGYHRLVEAMARGEMEIQAIVAPDALPRKSRTAKSARPATETPEFRRWFGESRVLDEDGKPLVVYHGSEKQFDEFRPSRSGALFFTDEQAIADEYGSARAVYLKAKKLLDLRDHGIESSAVRELGEAAKVDLASRINEEDADSTLVFSYLRKRNVVEALRAQGFDGVAFKDFGTPGGGDEVYTSYVVFDPRQVKSATGNRGTFDPTRASILEQGTRGVIRMRLDATGRPVDFPVELFATADVSTLAHEVGGHFLSWAMHDAAVSEKGAPLRKDYEALIKWAGYATPEERLQSNLERADLESRASLTAADETRLRALKAKEERIGHGFEQYLAEGKAPTAALARPFAKLRSWLLRIYRSLFAIQDEFRKTYGQDLGLSDEVRGVFDRWFAAETEVRTQEAALGGDVLLAALDPADRDAVLRAREARRVEAEATVYQTLTQAERAVNADVREKVRAEIEAQVAEEPTYRLLDYLKRSGKAEAGIVDVALGQLDASLLDEHGKPWKLSRPAVVAEYGEETAKRLPRGSTVKEGGADPTFLAEKFGFPGPDEMVAALTTAGGRAAVVDARTQARLRELYPSALENPAGVVQAAVDAEHSPKAVEEALVGARILVRRVDPTLGLRLKVMEDAKTRNATAKRITDEMRIADLSPQRFLQAERTAGRAAQEFTAKALGRETEKLKEYAAQAMDQREVQLLNMALWRAARDAQIEAQKAHDYLQDFTREKARRRLGKAISTETGPSGETIVTQPYLDRVDDLLGRIDLRKSGSQARAGQRFQSWLDEQPGDIRDDLLSRINPELLASLDKPTHWGTLTVQEMRDLVDAVDTVDARARLKSKLKIAGEERDFDETVGRIVDGIKARFPKGGAVSGLERADPILEKLKRAGLTLKAEFATREELYRELGPEITEAVWGELSRSYDEANRLIVEMAKPIADELTKLNRKDRAFLNRTFVVDGHRLDGEAALAMALNQGNASNDSKMVRGEQVKAERFKRARPIGRETIDKTIAMLGRSHWELVNRIHKQINSKWEQIAALEKEFTGLAPPKIEALPQTRTLADGSTIEVPGGYYPVVYDAKFSTAGQRSGEQVARGVDALAFAPSYERAVTAQGHLQSRIEPFARPIDLSLRGLQRAVVNHMRDLAMRRALVQTRDILTDGRVRDAIQEAMGPAVYQSLLEHWRKTANEHAEPQGPVDSLVRWMSGRKTMFTASVLGGNMALAIQNFANVPAAMDVVPAKHLAAAFGRFAVERMELVDRIRGESEYMRQRADFLEAATVKAGLRISSGRGRVDPYAEHVRRVAGWFMEGTDLAVAYPVYEGAKALAMSPKGEGVRGMPEGGSRATGFGMSEKEAIAFAEQTVRLSLSSYRWIDRPAFSQHSVFKPFTYFWGYMAGQMSRFMAVHFDSQQLWQQGYHMEGVRRATIGLGLLVAGGIMAEALVGNGPDDYGSDGEIGADDWARWLGTTGALYPFTTAPIVGSQIRNLGAPKGPSRDISLFPWIRGGQVAWKTIEAASKIGSEEAEGGEGMQAFLGTLEAVGWYYGAPVVQMRRTGDYWLDITPEGFQMSEEAAMASLPEAAWKTVYGKGRAGRLSEALFGGP